MPRWWKLYCIVCRSECHRDTGIASVFWQTRAWRTASPPANRPIVAQEGNYVTSNSCRACHPGNYASWHASFHRTMTQVATPATLIPEARNVELSFAGRQYRLEQKGDKIFVSSRSLGETDYDPPNQVVLLTGSHNLQILWTETGQGRTLEQFPFAYIIAEKMWAPVAQTFLMPPETKEAYSIGAWNGACMDCHVTQGLSKFVEGNRWDTKVAEFGIACEACHGEGRAHIAANRNPFRRWKLHLTKSADATIENASRMKGPQAALTCGQCHSVWAFNGMEEKLDWNRHGGKFRPGNKDLGQRFVVQPEEKDHPTQKEFIREHRAGFFPQPFLGRRDDPGDGPGDERRAGIALFQGWKLFLHLLPRNASGQDDAGRAQNLGAKRSIGAEDGLRSGLPPVSQGNGCTPNEPHASRGGFVRQPLL